MTSYKVYCTATAYEVTTKGRILFKDVKVSKLASVVISSVINLPRNLLIMQT